ncbi:MAG: hypothetical protein ACPLW7_05515 [Minisyncoccia bacterium]
MQATKEVLKFIDERMKVNEAKKLVEEDLFPNYLIIDYRLKVLKDLKEQTEDVFEKELEEENRPIYMQISDLEVIERSIKRTISLIDIQRLEDIGLFMLNKRYYYMIRENEIEELNLVIGFIESLINALEREEEEHEQD